MWGVWGEGGGCRGRPGRRGGAPGSVSTCVGVWACARERGSVGGVGEWDAVGRCSGARCAEVQAPGPRPAHVGKMHVASPTTAAAGLPGPRPKHGPGGGRRASDPCPHATTLVRGPSSHHVTTSSSGTAAKHLDPLHLGSTPAPTPLPCMPCSAAPRSPSRRCTPRTPQARRRGRPRYVPLHHAPKAREHTAYTPARSLAACPHPRRPTRHSQLSRS